MCSNCNCSPEAAIDPNIRKALAHLVKAQMALEAAWHASEWADHDYALENVIGEVEGIGVMLMENPDLSTLAESLGWSG